MTVRGQAGTTKTADNVLSSLQNPFDSYSTQQLFLNTLQGVIPLRAFVAKGIPNAIAQKL